MKAIRKDNVTPEQWAHRMEVQRKRRANPEIRARERAAERERWPASRKKANAAAYQRQRRAAGHYAESDKRRRERMEKDKSFRQKILNSQKAAYWKKPDYYRAHVAGHRERVSPCYVASMLRLPVAMLPEPVIELVRAQVKLKRELKRKNNL